MKTCEYHLIFSSVYLKFPIIIHLEVIPFNDPSAQTVNSLIFLDHLGLGTKIAVDEQSSLTGKTVTVEMGTDFAKLSDNCYRITPNQPAHYQQLLEFLAQDNFQIDDILHLWTYGEYTGEVSSLESFEQAQVLGVYSIQKY